MGNGLFGLLCTLCCRGEMALVEETGELVCTHHEIVHGRLVACGHVLRDNRLIRMLLSANAIACSGRESVPGYAVAPSERRKEAGESGGWTLFRGMTAYPLCPKPFRHHGRPNRTTGKRETSSLCPLPFRHGGAR